MRPALLIFLLVVAGVILGLGYYFIARPWVNTATHVNRLREYLNDPAAHVDWQITAGERCGEAPFILPTSGYLGFGYGDSWRPGQHHQGFDIFGPTGLGETPVIAAYDGYLTREADWKSTVIIRVPKDPLQPSRQIWNYYTHMADAQGNAFISADFPPGTREKFVRAGTRLGYQGNYSGNPSDPVGMHLHFSVVKDDGQGKFLNELRIENTLDPSPYLGLRAADGDDWSQPITCVDATPAP
jgi:murein DD-endopeptidase MepM/ murein hydrolase activator NlpD